jgi:L-ascorbate metabolism protein UlaG (beta-lactamase superfamily)
MFVEWLGHSAFRLKAGDAAVVIDPIGDVSRITSRGSKWDYPPIVNVQADLVLITHDHGDHNGAESIGGSPVLLRSTAGRFDSPFGEVVAVASEHDHAAGTERGSNLIFVLDVGGVRVAHFGDYGQRFLREEQITAIGRIDILFISVGGRGTTTAEDAAAIVQELQPRIVVPMHYRTHRVDFLDSVEPFVELMAHVERLDTTTFDPDALPVGLEPLVVVMQAP